MDPLPVAESTILTVAAAVELADARPMRLDALSGKVRGVAASSNVSASERAVLRDVLAECDLSGGWDDRECELLADAKLSACNSERSARNGKKNRRER